MRIVPLLMLALALPPLGAAAQQDPVTLARAPFVVEQTYWIKPGKELQFLGLFEKTQIPLLRAKLKDGRALWVRLSRPGFNAANDQWDLRLTVAWRDPDSAMGQVPTGKTPLTTEQQIMEELIVEHTDVPVQQWSLDDVALEPSTKP
jgi:hypothetical protein